LILKKYSAKRIKSQWVPDDNLNVVRFNKLSRIISDYCMYITSEGEELNLMGWSPHIKKKISGLPEVEQAYILHLFNRFSHLKASLSGMKTRVRRDVGGVNFEVLLESRKTYILELYAQHYSSEEIHKKLMEESGLKISFSSIRRFFLKYKVDIEKLRFDYEKEVGSIGIARKRSRCSVRQSRIMISLMVSA
jgi:hypothetical protein